MLRSIRVYLSTSALALAAALTFGIPAAHAAASPDICRPVQGCGCNVTAMSAHVSRLGPNICL
jgi:hypothetical protein